MDFEVRATQLADAEFIGPLMRSVWLQTYKHILAEDELLNQSYKVHQPELIAAELSNIDICSFVAALLWDTPEAIIAKTILYTLRAYIWSRNSTAMVLAHSFSNA